MKTTTTIRDRIATRAYFAWLNGETYDWREPTAVDHWLCAEQAELAADIDAARKRSAAARKAAETRKLNAALKAGDLVERERNTATRRRLENLSATAH